MIFHSILFENEDGLLEDVRPPEFLADLNLDQVIDTITAGRETYDLKPFFYTPLKDIGAIEYRHEIMQDLENDVLFENVISFSRKMRAMRKHLARVKKLHYKYQQESWFLDAVTIYCDAVHCLTRDLSPANLRSRGFLAFREYLANYIDSDRFTSLLAETEKLKAELSAVRYRLLIRGNRVRVGRYESEVDYSTEVVETFEKFKQGVVKDYRVEFSESDMNHVEAKVLDLVAQLYPETFRDLDDFCVNNSDYLDEKIGVFDREIQFYLAYLQYLAVFRRAGLKFCYPRIARDKEVRDYEGFDLALAYKLITEGSAVVCNDFHLKGSERLLVVSGPNQGGKTTFARTFGQLHYLAALGCPVPGSEARLFLFDNLFTHFEREENIKELRGKLQDDLIRIHDIIEQATPDSIIIMNEIFSSTTLKDAIFLSRKVLEEILCLDSLGVCVTFIDELSSLSEKTVSMVSTVVPENPALRTYRIVRKPADGLAYAISIAEKHRLTYHRLKERLRS